MVAGGQGGSQGVVKPNATYNLDMDPSIGKALIKCAEAAVEPAKDFLNRLAGPAADEMGLHLGERVRLYRFKNELKMLAKAEKMMADAGFSPKVLPIKLLLPLLEHAALEEDNDMQTRWAALLANAANPNEDVEVRSLFPDTLNQLSPNEAKLLDAIFNKTLAEHESSAPQADLASMQAVSPSRFSRLELESMYTRLGLTSHEFPLTLDNAQGAALKEVGRIQSEVDNLIRLELLRRNSTWKDGDRSLTEKYFLTALGVKFVAACQKPTAGSSVVKSRAK